MYAYRATHRLNAILSSVPLCAHILRFLMKNINIGRCSNPASTADEFAYQCGLAKPKLIIASPDQLEPAAQAARKLGIPLDRIVPIETTSAAPQGVPHLSVTDLIVEGVAKDQRFFDRRLGPGEAKTMTAMYCFSSGTTGLSKVLIGLPN